MVSRLELERDYSTRDGLISSPGKFEGEPLFVPYFYDIAMNGFGVAIYGGGEDGLELDGEWFAIEDGDREAFPELENARFVVLWYSSDGFVSHELTDAVPE